MSGVDTGRAMYAGTRHTDDGQRSSTTERGRLMYAASRGDKDARDQLAKEHSITAVEHADYDA